MTVLVGILCTDGVLIAADGAATYRAGTMRSIEQPTKKIEIIGGQVIIATSGEAGLGQRFCETVRAAWTDNLYFRSFDAFAAFQTFKGQAFKQADAWIKARMLAFAAIHDFQMTGAWTQQTGGFLNANQGGGCGALVAFPQGNKQHMFEFATNDFQPEKKEADKGWFVSMGSGQLIADPMLAFFRDNYLNGEQPSVRDALFITTLVMDHVVKVNAGGVNGPVSYATLENPDGKAWRAKVLETELEEPRDRATEFIERMKSFGKDLPPEEIADAPDVPRT